MRAGPDDEPLWSVGDCSTVVLVRTGGSLLSLCWPDKERRRTTVVGQRSEIVTV